LTATAGNPFICTDNTNFLVASTGNLSKRSLASGASVYSVAVSNISTTADPVVASDYVYVATTDGYVYKKDAGDLTPIATFGQISGAPSINLPLLLSGTTLYVTPNNGTLYALPLSTMTRQIGP